MSPILVRASRGRRRASPSRELGECVVELLLADVEAAEPPPHPDAVRVEGEDALVELDRLLGAILELVGQGEIGEDELRLRFSLSASR